MQKNDLTKKYGLLNTPANRNLRKDAKEVSSSCMYPSYLPISTVI